MWESRVLSTQSNQVTDARKGAFSHFRHYVQLASAQGNLAVAGVQAGTEVALTKRTLAAQQKMQSNLFQHELQMQQGNQSFGLLTQKNDQAFRKEMSLGNNAQQLLVQKNQGGIDSMLSAQAHEQNMELLAAKTGLPQHTARMARGHTSSFVRDAPPTYNQSQAGVQSGVAPDSKEDFLRATEPQTDDPPQRTGISDFHHKAAVDTKEALRTYGGGRNSTD